MNHLDDVLVLLYAIGGVLVSILFWRELTRFSRVLAPFSIGIAFTASSILIDATAPVEGIAPYFEELAELAGTFSFALALERRWRIARIPAPIKAVALARHAPD